MATIKTVANLWKLEKQNKHAQDIAKRAGLLFDKFTGFLTNLEDVGKSLQKALGAHDHPLDSFRPDQAILSVRQKNFRLWAYGRKKKFLLLFIGQ